MATDKVDAVLQWSQPSDL